MTPGGVVVFPDVDLVPERPDRRVDAFAWALLASSASCRIYQIRICSSSQPSPIPTSWVGWKPSLLSSNRVVTHWLERMDDLGEPVVVVGRFDERLVVVSRRGGCGDRKLNCAEYDALLADLENGNSRSVALDERGVGRLLVS